MNKVLAFILLATGTTAHANIADVMVCTNEDWAFTIGVNAVPDDSDTVAILVEGAEGGTGGYTASIPKGQLFEALKNGMKVDDPASGTKDVATLILKDGQLTVTNTSGTKVLNCETVE